MRLVMVNPNERLGQGKSHPLRRPQANQQRAGQAGAASGRHGIELLRCHVRFAKRLTGHRHEVAQMLA